MTYTADPRVDSYIDALPDWQKAVCREVRDLVHAADPEVGETIKYTDRPYFVLQGNICALLAAKDHVNVFLYDGAIVADPQRIITAGHENSTARTVAVRQGETINAPALTAMFKHIISNNRAGGWRKLKTGGAVSVVIDHSTEFGARTAGHLRDETVVWMTTVTPAGSPLPMPVWFLWDGAESIVMYSMPGARVRNIEANPRVTLNFAGDGGGGDIVVISGNAAIDHDAPPADQPGEYRAKYDEHITRIGMTPESFAQRYSVPVRILFTRLRGH